MAVVPRFQRRPVQMTGGVPRVVPDISSLVQGAAQIGQAIAVRGEQMRRTDQQMIEVQIDNKFREMRLNSLNFKGGAARGLSDTLAKSKSDLYNSMASEIEDPITREQIRVYFERQFGKQMAWTRGYEIQQEDDYRKNVDVAVRTNNNLKGNEVPIGDTESLDALVRDSTHKFVEREGLKNVGEPRAQIYKQAHTDEMYAAQVRRWFNDDPVEALAWYDKNEEQLKLKLSPKVFNTIAEIAEREEAPAERLRIWREVKADYGNNLLGAFYALNDPDKVKKYNPKSLADIAAVQSSIQTHYSMNRALANEREKRLANAYTNTFLEELQGLDELPLEERAIKIDVMERELARTDSIPPTTKSVIFNNLKRADFEINNLRVLEVMNDIDQGRITEPSQIRAMVGSGIGRVENVRSLENYLARHKRDKAQGNLNYYNNAVDSLRGKMAEQKARLSRGERERYLEARREGRYASELAITEEDITDFKAYLDAKRKELGYSVYDPRLMDVAEKALDIVYKRRERSGREITIPESEYGGFLRSKGEFSRFAFQEAPDVDTDVVRRRVEEGETPQEQPGAAQVDIQKQERIRRFQQLRDNPESIPGNTPEEKLEYMIQLGESVTGQPLSGVRIDQLRNSIGQ